MIRIVVAALAAAALTACFSPSFQDTTCGVNESCPPGYHCVDGVCRTDGMSTDAAPPTVTLTLTRGGTGTGAVTSAPTGLDCGTTCSAGFAMGTMVTLTAAPATGSTLTSWGGACSGSATTCTITLTADTTVTADFALTMHTVTVVRGGNGTGTVTSTPAGITCGATCTTSVPYGSSITLGQSAGASSVFLGWSGGGCTGTADCTLTVTDDVSINASFGLNFSLVVTRTGNGTGSVTSAPAGINCGADCDEVYAAGTMVTLTAMATATSTFAGWSGGGCTGTGTCTVTINAAVAVNADFALRRYTLTAATAGPGGGTVTSSPTGINCGSDCTELYDHGTSVTLTATPNGVSTFTGWTGACTGPGPCVVTMDMARSVTASFGQQTAGLTVARAGNGSGTVTSSPAGINCGADCNETYALGTVVTLTAVPATGSAFTGWAGGGCSGFGTCVVTFGGATTVTANFTLEQYPLDVAKNGTGTGTVTSSPAGINCGTDCNEAINHGTMVTLTAAPASGSTFTSWSGGGCTGSVPTCVVTVTSATTVTATFTAQYTLTVMKGGNGAGTVTATGINCGTDCSEFENPGSMVTLTATAATTPLSQSSTFVSWSSLGCGTATTCVVTMTASTTVTATFTLRPNYVFVASTIVNGNMGGLAGADAICQTNAESFGLTGTYRAWLSSDTVSAISRLGTASGWIRPDGKTFARSQSDLIAGRQLYPIRQFANGSEIGGIPFYTATGLDGTLAPFTTTCNNWTVTSALMTTGGSASGVGGVWTSSYTVPCQNGFHIACLGIDRVAPLPPLPAATGRRVFVTAGMFSPFSGIATADNLCQSEANTAGLGGTYRALLGAVGASPASRFNTTGTIVRPDNLVLGPATDFFTQNYWESALNVRADGSIVGTSLDTVISGNSGSLTDVGTINSTCNNWSNPGGNVTTGTVGDSWVAGALNYFNVPCMTTSKPVICLQI